MTLISVILADDHAMFREGVKLLLENSGEVEVVAQASSGEEAVCLARQLTPDIVVMDLSMPGMSGVEATASICQELPNTRVLALTMHESTDYFFQTFQAGASGYVLKEAAGMDLLVALKAVSRGGVFIYPSLAGQVLSDFLQRVGDGEELASYETLTPREQEILGLIGEGKSNQEISSHLNVTVNTVQTHRGHIMEKLGFHGRSELMRYAIRTGHLRPSG